MEDSQLDGASLFRLVWTPEVRAEMDELVRQINACLPINDFANAGRIGMLCHELKEARYDRFAAELGIPKAELRYRCLLGSLLDGPVYQPAI